MRTTLRLLLKTHRFEVVAIVLACVVLAGADLFLANQLDAAALPAACVFVPGSGPQPPAAGSAQDLDCQARNDALDSIQGRVTEALGFGAALPVLAGILLGVAVVGRELETGTASLAWTLGRSRTRWFVTRCLALAAILGVALALPALAANMLEGARQPLADPGSSFADGGVRGSVFVLRGVMAFGVGLVAGALIGRQLPALIVALALALVVLVGFEAGVGSWKMALAVWRPESSSASGAGDLVLNQAYRDRATGTIVDENTVIQLAPQVNGGADSDWINAHYELVDLRLAGDQYQLVAVGESGALGGIALLFLGAGLVVVNRRSPG
jgi:hypothetical protein